MIKWLMLLFTFNHAFAVPMQLEVWFLSSYKKAEVQKMILEKQFIMGPMTARLECQEMGDLCFDPQYGLYKRDDAGLGGESQPVKFENAPSIPAAKSVERDLIDCDPKNHFDIFCGKSQKDAQANYKLELWIDTSSSMREMDFSDKEGGCYRKSLVKKLDKSCGFNQKVNVMVFDTSIKQAGSMESLCNNQGLNDTKRMIDWIERSNAKKLIIITDINEYTKTFSDYIESKNGKFRGEKNPLSASELTDLSDELIKMCR